MNTFTLSLPIFGMIFIGMAASRLRYFDDKLSDFLASMLFNWMMPITLFYEISRLPIEKILEWAYIKSYFVAAIVIMLQSAIASRHYWQRDKSNTIINMMAASFTNTGYLGLPLFLMLFDTVTPVASVILVQVIFNFCILLGLDVFSNHKKRKLGLKTAVLVIIENPILLGNILGIAWSFCHLNLPNSISSVCEILSHLTSYVALFTLGLSLGLAKLALNKKQKVEIAFLVFLKTLVHPILALTVGYYIFDLHGFLLTALTLMAAMPTGKNLFIFAKRFNVGTERSNIIVVISTMVSMILLNIILLLTPFTTTSF